MASIECYEAVWREDQNRMIREDLMVALQDGHTVQIELQPGDMTRYLFSLTPVTSTFRYDVSDEGRTGGLAMFIERPFGIILTVLNEDFASRSAHFWNHEIDQIDMDEVHRRLGTRSLATAAAALQTLRAVFAGGLVEAMD